VLLRTDEHRFETLESEIISLLLNKLENKVFDMVQSLLFDDHGRPHGSIADVDCCVHKRSAGRFRPDGNMLSI